MKKIKSFIVIIIQYVKVARDYYLVLKSGLFNKRWYLKNNPDVVKMRINPLRHYIKQGGFEKRDPGPDFSSSWYLDTYKDVQNSGLNPLVHYLKCGKHEGREKLPPIRWEETTNHHLVRKNLLLPFTLKKQKVFCIGSNKTGTTSLEKVLQDFGYKTGDQKEAELLVSDWAIRDFRRIIRHCETADAFQDIPFSLDYTYQALDHAFPGAKFILTIRNNSDEWYRSLIRFHGKLLGVDRIPTPNDLKNFVYHGKGYLWHVQRYVLGVDETNLYDENIYKKNYENHNSQIKEYFRYRKDDLLVINLSDPTAMQTLCSFLDIKFTGQEMPHLNSSQN